MTEQLQIEEQQQNHSPPTNTNGGAKDPTKKNRSKRPLIIAIILIVGLSIALAVVLVIHFQEEDGDGGSVVAVVDGDNSGGHGGDGGGGEDEVGRQMMVDGASVTSRTGVVVDCMPSLRRVPEKMKDTKARCLELGCVWQRTEEVGAPWCVYPSDHGYEIVGYTQDTSSGVHVDLRRIDFPWDDKLMGEVFTHLDVDVEIQTERRLRVKISPKNVTRYEVPQAALDIEQTSNENLDKADVMYNVTFTSNPFGVVVTRKDTGTVVFNSAVPGMEVSEQFLQLTSLLPTSNVFGFGEHRHLAFKHDMRWKRWSMFTRDTGPNNDWNLYGHHPVYMNVESDGKANIVLLKNSNAMEVVLQPSPEPAVTYKTIGGVLDFYIFLGDSPQDVAQTYQKSIGLPAFPPYWSLGYHLCRWGYKDISDMKAVIDRNRAAGIPYDGQWGDYDTFIKAFVFTYDDKKWPNFPSLVEDLRNHSQHFITIIDPGVGVDESVTQEVQASFPDYDVLGSGERAGVMVLDADNETIHGEVWPGVTAFPDFTNPDSQAWWSRWIDYYINTVGVEVDALWIDMNEPASFVPGSTKGCRRNRWNYPPYVPDVDGSREEGALFVKTLCMDAQQYWGRHYDVHSLYAHSMAQRTFGALATVRPNKRPWVMTRSSYPGTGHYATKWQGDNKAAWEDMHFSIISIMEFGMFGFPMNGADICGFWMNTTFELCVRWHQLGAFYPFSRNHNGRGEDNEENRFIDQDPASFGQEFVDLVKPALMTRYKLLPYLYTLLYRAHTGGKGVLQPLFFEFPFDVDAMEIDKQFMLGPCLLVSPVLEQGSTSVKAYFPAGPWFDYLTGETVTGPGTVVLDTPINKFNVHIRAGHVIPWQEPSTTTAASRLNHMGLLVALNESGVASGELYWDDGESTVSKASPNFNIIKFEMSKAGELKIKPDTKRYATDLKFNTLEIYGLPRSPSWVKVNGNDLSESAVVVNGHIFKWTGLDLAMNSESTITWSVY